MNSSNESVMGGYRPARWIVNSGSATRSRRERLSRPPTKQVMNT